jgi:hypothetical protein
MRLRFSCVLVVLSAVAHAQQGSVDGPSTGYVFDATAKAVRQVRGIPGAALMSDKVDFGIRVGKAELATHGDFAAVLAADGALHLFRLANGQTTEVLPPNVIRSTSRMVFSPSGTALLLFGDGKIQVLTGLPDSPVAGEPQLVAAADIRIGVGALAVSDDGAYVLLGRGQSVWVMSKPGSDRMLTEAGTMAGVAFAPGTHDAAVVNGGKLSVFGDVGGASTRQDFTIAPAHAVAFSADRSKVVVVGAPGVILINRATGESRQLACECQITGLTPMGTYLRLNNPGTDPIWLLDPTPAEPRLVFVPLTAN